LLHQLTRELQQEQQQQQVAWCGVVWEWVACLLARSGRLEERAEHGAATTTTTAASKAFPPRERRSGLLFWAPVSLVLLWLSAALVVVVVSKYVVWSVWHDWHFFENVIGNIISHFYLLYPPPPLGEHNGNLMKTHWELIREHVGNKGKIPHPPNLQFYSIGNNIIPISHTQMQRTLANCKEGFNRNLKFLHKFFF
jgi:hypothetical protein